MPTSLSVRTKALVTVAAVGATAAVAGLGTFSQFNSMTNVSSNVSSGTINISLGAGGTIASGVSGLLAGDSHEMTVDVVNGSAGIGQISLTAASSASTPSLLTQAGGLQVGVQSCPAAWTVSGTLYTCGSGTPATVLTTQDVAALSSPQTLANLNLANGATNHLLFTLTLPSSVGDTYQGLSDTIAWTFTAVQRAGTNV